MEDLLDVEKEANSEIRKALPVSSLIAGTQNDLADFNLRRGTDKTENIRIVSIEGLDQTPCGGLHVQSSSQLGLIKYTGQEKIRSRLRLKWKIGLPAYNDYTLRYDQIENISRILAVSPDKATERLEALILEKQKENKMLKSLLDKEAERISHDLSRFCLLLPPPSLQESSKIVLPSCFKGIVKNLSTTRDLSFLICTEYEGRLDWALHLPQHKTLKFEEFQKECLSLIDGKGGGKGPLWQGSGQNPGKAEAFLKTFREICHTE